MADHDTHDHTGVPGAGSPTEITDIPTAEMDDSLVLAPDGAGGVEFRAESGGVTGTLIGFSAYNTSGNYTTAGTSIADMDATNLLVTFTAPASGNVMVRLTCWAEPTGSSSRYLVWGLRESSSTVGVPVRVCHFELASLSGSNQVAVLYVTGVSGGSHTYKFAAAHITNPIKMVWGGGSAAPGAAVMEVFALA